MLVALVDQVLSRFVAVEDGQGLREAAQGNQLAAIDPQTLAE